MKVGHFRWPKMELSVNSVLWRMSRRQVKFSQFDLLRVHWSGYWWCYSWSLCSWNNCISLICQNDHLSTSDCWQLCIKSVHKQWLYEVVILSGTKLDLNWDSKHSYIHQYIVPVNVLTKSLSSIDSNDSYLITRASSLDIKQYIIN